jgi:ABC-type branched-subunit amino acid transport system permease subunit/ABC-type branched-subunit amino acid transport system ATPase component
MDDRSAPASETAETAPPKGTVAGRWESLRTTPTGRVLATFGPWLLGALALFLFTQGSSDYVLLIASTVIIYAISAIGLNVLMGQAGLVSIGNAALMAVGAYTTAIIGPKQFWGAFPIPLIISAVVGGVVGLIIALPALRLRGIYLALATLALQFFVSFAGDRYQSETGKVSGVVVPPLTLGGHDFSSNARDFVLLLGVILGLTILVVRAMSRHAPGRMWNALRESELAATAIGVNAARWKLAAFVVSSSIIAVSGSLLGYANQIVSSESFTLEFAVSFIVILILGGMGTMSGAIVGAVVVVSLPYVLTNATANLPQDGFGSWITNNIFYINNGLYGILVLLVLLYLPEGIVPALGRALRWGVRLAPTPRTERQRRRQKAVRIEPTGDDTTALLSVRDLAVTYQTGAKAVHGLNLRVQPGAIVGLLGRNGAGKTSTLRAISGFLLAEQVKLGGYVSMEDHDLIGSSPMKTATRGIVLVPERDKIFPSLTVGEHLKLVSSADFQRVLERPYFQRLRERLDQPAGLLSGGERQLLALATASLLEPKLLMVDEFTLGLAPVMIHEVSRVIRGLRDDGMTILLVEQNAAAALELSDWLYLMEGGQIVAEGAPADMADRIMFTTEVKS